MARVCVLPLFRANRRIPAAGARRLLSVRAPGGREHLLRHRRLADHQTQRAARDTATSIPGWRKLTTAAGRNWRCLLCQQLRRRRQCLRPNQSFRRSLSCHRNPYCRRSQLCHRSLSCRRSQLCRRNPNCHRSQSSRRGLLFHRSQSSRRSQSSQHLRRGWAKTRAGSCQRRNSRERGQRSKPTWNVSAEGACWSCRLSGWSSDGFSLAARNESLDACSVGAMGIDSQEDTSPFDCFRAKRWLSRLGFNGKSFAFLCKLVRSHRFFAQ